MKEKEIDHFMTKLHSRSEADHGIIKKDLTRFLGDDFKDMVSYMNDAFFIRDQNMFAYLRSSINQGNKTDD
jgi:hypothetical protein